MSPDGAEYSSPGHRPGRKKPTNRYALKGQNKNGNESFQVTIYFTLTGFSNRG